MDPRVGAIRQTAATNSESEEEQVKGDDFFSLENLQRRIASYVENTEHHRKICVAIAGGGSTFLSTLAATPGASSTLLEGTVTYSRQSFQDFVATHTPNHTIETATCGALVVKNEDESSSFKYCSREAAQLLAQAAYHQASRLTTSTRNAFLEGDPTTDWATFLRNPIAGLGCTSVLQSVQARQSFRHKGSRAFVSASTTLCRDGTNSSSVELEAHLAAASTSERSRFEEDVFVAHCVLSCLEYVRDIGTGAATGSSNESSIRLPGVEEHHREEFPIAENSTNDRNDSLSIQGKTEKGDHLQLSISPHPANSVSTTEDVLRQAAERILSGQDEAVLLLPTAAAASSPVPGGSLLEALDAVRLPPNSLVVPGSFNPPHVGHLALAKAAASAMANEDESDGDRTAPSSSCSAIWFELSITNADKPALAVDAVVDRLQRFLSLPPEELPDCCWGLLLTNAPLFKQKVDLLAPLQRSEVDDDSALYFCIGTDTLVRLIDPKYYNKSREEMLQVLGDMPCRFVVGGRLEQNKGGSGGDDKKRDPVFVTGEEDVRRLPPELQTKFTILPDFRVDISSTELRRKLAEQEQQQQAQRN